MEDLSEEAIRNKCLLCAVDTQSYYFPLEETDDFRIICDSHPLVKGHLLVIPKAHVSCIGQYEPYLFDKFRKIYAKASAFVQETYGSVATFEHGIYGQTIFHSHTHFLPYKGTVTDIIPEGDKRCTVITDLVELRNAYKKNNGYLFFSIDGAMWTVDISLTEPRFFRDRFASALGKPERGNWKNMHNDKQMMKIATKENQNVQDAWAHYPSSLVNNPSST
jgi:diadenosine tetraphosphate (Ap4A) HIT family hydrolase